MRNPMPDGVLDLARLDCSASHRPGPAEAVCVFWYCIPVKIMVNSRVTKLLS
jgi:hypothetical protein